MKKRNRLFTFALVFALLLSLAMLVGCSGSEETDDSDESAVPVGLVTSDSSSENDEDIGEEHDEPSDVIEGSWAIYWYLCGSDLETRGGFASGDIDEMLGVQLPENVTVVIQTGGSVEWQSEVVDASAMYRLEYTSEGMSVIETVESASMGESDTLSGFLEFCEANYPAERKALVFWDHGGGSTAGICYDELYEDDYLTLVELQDAFGSVYGEPGDVMPFELIGFDACLMATVDTAAVCSGYAGYMVASEETEPGCGWKYDGWLGALAEDPEMAASELGEYICDTYYQGCEEIEQAADVTLSTIDLSRVGEVVRALDALGREGITAALENSPAAFFAEYGRGAKKSDYYADGGHDLADLASLVSNNRELFPDTADALLQSIRDCVVYQVTGPYRADSNGIAAYFPYTMSTDMYDIFYSSAAAPAMSYMYELLMTGEIPDTAKEYLAQAEEFEPSVLDNEYEFTDTSELGLEDHVVDIIEEDGVTYAQMNIGADAAEPLSQVTFMLVSFLDGGDEMVFLGEEYDLMCDWENGIFTDNFRGVWGAIDGHLIMMTVTSLTDEFILYDVPIILNGEMCSLSVAYRFEDGSYNILTATPDDGEGGIAPKKEYQLMPGDEITTVLYYVGDDDEGYYENETFTVAEDTAFHELDLEDGTYAFVYVMKDYKNNEYMSEVVGVEIEDGFPTMFSLD